MDARAKVESLCRQVEDTIRPLLSSVERVALVDFPNTANVGDSAIYLGELACLAAIGVPRPRFICDLRTYDRAELARSIGDSGVILLAGGGSFGDVWPATQELREEILRSFPRNRIIQLPQTIHFASIDALRRARAAADSHPKLTILARDSRSLEVARNEFRARSVLCPDIAFAVGPVPRPRAPDRAVLWLLRTDKESRAVVRHGEAGEEVDWLDELPMILRDISYLLMGATRRKPFGRYVRPLLMSVYRLLARQRVRRGLDMLAAGKVVITDRIHGHILCLLMGVPHVLLDNSYGKLSTFHRTWTADTDLVRWAESPEEAREWATRFALEPARHG
ncbi:MAG: polysaccharide pyruvyl transferase family protein [Gemmatimonadaceae bacterium]